MKLRARARNPFFRHGLALGFTLGLALLVRAEPAPESLAPACEDLILPAPAGAPPRPAILLLHGVGNCPWEMGHVATRLQRAGYPVLAPRLPGHGTRPEDLLAHAPAAFTAFARHQVRRATELGANGRVIAGGSSFGGLLATLALEEEPLTVAGAFLLAPFFDTRPEGLARAACDLSHAAESAATLTDLLADIPYAAYVPLADAPSRHPEWSFWYTRYPTRFLCTATALADHARGRASLIRAPLLVITSEADTVISSDAAHLALLPSARPDRLHFGAADQVQHLMARNSPKTNPRWDAMMTRIESFAAAVAAGNP
jgi:carboxylesterase